MPRYEMRGKPLRHKNFPSRQTISNWEQKICRPILPAVTKDEIEFFREKPISILAHLTAISAEIVEGSFDLEFLNCDPI